jgi:hypothetical protein
MDINKLDLKDLWSTQTVHQPGIDEVMKRIDTFKRSGRRKAIFTNLCLGATAIFILSVWYYFQPELITTKIGIIVVIAAIGMYIVAVNRVTALFKKTDEAKSNDQYLENLLQIKAKQQVVQTKVLNLYFALLLVGLALYMYEYTSRMTLLWAITTYAITGAWILLNWFYIRPRVVRKQQAKIGELIGKMEGMRGQLKG